MYVFVCDCVCVDMVRVRVYSVTYPLYPSCPPHISSLTLPRTFRQGVEWVGGDCGRAGDRA